jgi:hypothetical protein
MTSPTCKKHTDIRKIDRAGERYGGLNDPSVDYRRRQSQEKKSNANFDQSDTQHTKRLGNKVQLKTL